MRYLKPVILVLANALISPAFAQTCCPAGCVQDADRCVTTGPNWTICTPIACAGDSRRPSGGSSGRTGAHRASVPARPLRTARTYAVRGTYSRDANKTFHPAIRGPSCGCNSVGLSGRASRPQ